LGWKIPGCEVHITATLPAGGGLSSSAALEVGMATVVETLCGRQLPPGEKALLCQQAEHEFAGVPCGIMDPFAVTFAKAGHAMLLDCRTQEIEYVPLDVRQVLVLLIHSGVKHDLAEGEYAKRRHECEAAARLLGVASLRDIDRLRWQKAERLLPEPLQRRARHVVTEHDRTLGFVQALKTGGLEAAGEYMFGSHDSLSRDYEVSCPELDLLVEMAEGVFGCRMTGAGFGGCVVALVDADLCQSVQQALRTGYRQATGRDPWMIVTHAVQGAARV
jgi:galactokinase